jgi:hypothetical protein
MHLTEIDDTRAVAEPSEPSSAAPKPFWQSERVRAIVAIGFVVLLANCTYIFHIFNPNPINQDSGLGMIAQPGLLAGQNNIDPNIGFTAQALGHRAAVDWLHGEIPWWNPYEGTGAPLAGEMQSAAFFPLNALNLLPGGQVYFRLSLEFLAGVGTYLLMRRFTRSNLPAVVGGIAFALNGTYSWLFHAPGNPIAFLPFILLGFEWAWEGACGLERKGWPLLAVALSLSFYAGFPETAFIDGLLAALWLLARAVALPRRSLATFAQSIGLGVGVGALLSAPILVAFLGYLPNADVGGHAGGFAWLSLSATTALPAQIMPYLFGPIFGFVAKDPSQLLVFWGNIGGYLGASLCTLALIGLAGHRYRTLRIVLALWVLVGLARLVGVDWALHLINAIPGVKSTAFYRYANPSWELAVVVLATLGLDDLIHRSTRRVVIIGSGVVMVALCALSWHAAHSVFQALEGAPHNTAWARASLVWALTTIIAIVILGLLPDRGPRGSTVKKLRGSALAGVVIIDVFALFVTPQFSAPREAAIDTKPVAFLEQHLGQNRFYTLGPLAPNYGSYFGLGSVAVNDVPIPKAYESYVLEDLDSNVDPLVFDGVATSDPQGATPEQELVEHLASYEDAGVKYVLLPAGTSSPLVGGHPLRLVFRDATTGIVQLPHPMSLFSAIRGSCSVRAQSQTAVTVDCRRPSTIVYRETYMPGWHASANGRSVSVRSYGPIFQSVKLPAGRFSLDFGYTPPHTTLAFAAFLLGVLVLACAFVPLEKVPLPVRRRRGRS